MGRASRRKDGADEEEENGPCDITFIAGEDGTRKAACQQSPKIMVPYLTFALWTLPNRPSPVVNNASTTYDA